MDPSPKRAPSSIQPTTEESHLRRGAAPGVPLGKPGRLAKGRGPKADRKRRSRRGGLGQAAGECPPNPGQGHPTLWEFSSPPPITSTPVLKPHPLPEPRKASS